MFTTATSAAVINSHPPEASSKSRLARGHVHLLKTFPRVSQHFLNPAEHNLNMGLSPTVQASNMEPDHPIVSLHHLPFLEHLHSSPFGLSVPFSGFQENHNQWP